MSTNQAQKHLSEANPQGLATPAQVASKSRSVSAETETVFIVDDDPSICAGISDLLESAGLTTRQFSSAEGFIEYWSEEFAGCLVLDVRLPGISGLELQSKLVESGISLPVIIMTAHGDVPMVRKALKAGALEFLSKPFRDDDLLNAVQQALDIDRDRRCAESKIRALQSRANSLTVREHQVMEYVADGLPNKDIADRLCLSIITIKLHRGQVMRKMQASSLADLVKMCHALKTLRRPDATSPSL